MHMGRLILVSNRLPFTIEKTAHDARLRQSSGGLVSAIKSYFESDHLPEDVHEKLWVGVADFPQEEWEQVEWGRNNQRFYYTIEGQGD